MKGCKVVDDQFKHGYVRGYVRLENDGSVVFGFPLDASTQILDHDVRRLIKVLG